MSTLLPHELCICHNWAEDNLEMSISQIVNATNLCPRAAEKALQGLKEKGFVEQMSIVHWRICNKNECEIVNQVTKKLAVDVQTEVTIWKANACNR